MNDEDLNKTFDKLFLFMKSICIIILLSIVFLIIFIWSPSKVSALEVKNPDRTMAGYYGYNLPIRVANSQTTSNYVDVAITNGSFNTEIHQKFDVLNRIAPDELGVFAYDGTKAIQMIKRPGNTYLTLGFHPGNITTNIDDMLVDGNKMYYDGIFTYSFNLIVFGKSPISDISGFANTNYTLNENSWNYTYNRVEKIQDRYDDVNKIYIKEFKITINEPTDGRINPTSTFLSTELEVPANSCNNLVCNQYVGKGALRPSYGNSTTNFGSTNNDPYYFIVQAPYDITFWTQQSSLTCSTQCWTQTDTDNNNEWGPDDTNNYFGSFWDYVFFRDHGLGGIITSTYTKLRDILLDYDPNSCHVLHIPIFSKDVAISCGRTFWDQTNKPGLSLITNLYNSIWIFLSGYFIVRSIYKYLVDTFDLDDIKAKDVLKL